MIPTAEGQACSRTSSPPLPLRCRTSGPLPILQSRAYLLNHGGTRINTFFQAGSGNLRVFRNLVPGFFYSAFIRVHLWFSAPASGPFSAGRRTAPPAETVG